MEHITTCDKCQSNNIHFDYKGFYVCHTCGLVIDEIPVIEDSPNFFTSEDSTMGNAASEFTPLKNGTVIGDRYERSQNDLQYRRMHALQTREFASNYMDVKTTFEFLKSKCNITLKDDLFINPFKKIFQSMKKGTLCRNLHVLGTVVFFNICKKNGVQLNLSKTLSFYKITEKQYFKVYKEIMYTEHAHLLLLDTNTGEIKDYIQSKLSFIAFEFFPSTFNSVENPEKQINRTQFIEIVMKIYSGIKKTMKDITKLAISLNIAQKILLFKKYIDEEDFIKPYIIANILHISHSEIYNFCNRKGERIINKLLGNTQKFGGQNTSSSSKPPVC